MKTLTAVLCLLYCSHAHSYDYVKSDFFGHFAKLQKQANLENKPIVIVAGFDDCIGCDQLKEKVRLKEKKFNQVAEFFWMSTLEPDSYLFYSSLGIERIASAPRTYLVKPHSNKATSMGREIEIETIKSLMD